MNKTELLNSVTRSFHNIGFQLKKHSPEILVVAGVVGTVASAVMACKATTKLDSVLEESKDEIDKIKGYVEENGYSEKYTEEDQKKDLAIVYTQSAIKVIKLYGPSIALGALSLSAILSSNHILRKRNIALAAAYTTLDKGFKEYRGRVIERFGKELDRELRYNIKAKEVQETVVDENGEEHTETKTVEVVDKDIYSDYARFYDDGCIGWKKDPEANLIFLRRQEDYFNDKLKVVGHVFLNEVYDALGIPRTKSGQVVGWVYDEKNPIGDNYIDFGIYDVYNCSKSEAERKTAFVNGYERSIILDFNVDGNIWELMK